MPRMSTRAATVEVARRDPAFGPVIERAGPIRPRAKNPDGPFGALVRSIAYQQLAGKAAAAIHGRFRALVPGLLTPEAVLGLAEEDMRGAGLSAAKTASILDLAARAARGELALTHLTRVTDDELGARLSAGGGLGRGTAGLFLLFELGRPDVWPTGDLAVREGWRLMHGLEAPPTPRQLDDLGEPLRPIRSVAAWYCWQAVHIARGEV